MFFVCNYINKSNQIIYSRQSIEFMLSTSTIVFTVTYVQFPKRKLQISQRDEVFITKKKLRHIFLKIQKYKKYNHYENSNLFFNNVNQNSIVFQHD